MRLVAAAVLFLAACSPAPADTSESQAPAQTTEADIGKPAGAAQAGDPPTPAQLVGRWGDNGDCTKDIVFNADGTFRSYTGGSGTWSLDGDVMTMTSTAGTFQVRTTILNGNQLLVGNPDGAIGISQRC